MQVELINTGSELMLGRVLNTHQPWLCRRLADAGYVVSRQVAVADTGADIEQALREALGRAELILTTGGLGPTSDDLTRDSVARLSGRSLVLDESVLARIRGFFEARKRTMPESTRVQAMVPEGALVLPNEHGTAPGLAIEIPRNAFREGKGKSWLIMLPGPPRELRPMFTQQVVPLLARVMPPPNSYFCQTLRTTGIGELMVEEEIAAELRPLVSRGLDLGYCSRPGQVDVRVAGRGVAGEQLVEAATSVVRDKLRSYFYGEGDVELEEVIVRLMTERRQTLAVAESCTGGCISHRITNVPGASAVLLAGLVTYSNAAKQKFLGVRAETLAAHGAVSQAVAREMAEGARLATGASYSVAVTGIAGPGGETPGKPVGTVFIALAGPFPTRVVRNLNPFDRETFKQVTAQQALEMLRRAMVGGLG